MRVVSKIYHSFRWLTLLIHMRGSFNQCKGVVLCCYVFAVLCFNCLLVLERTANASGCQCEWLVNRCYPSVCWCARKCIRTAVSNVSLPILSLTWSYAANHFNFIRFFLICRLSTYSKWKWILSYNTVFGIASLGTLIKFSES